MHRNEDGRKKDGKLNLPKKKKIHKRNFQPHMSVSLQVTGMIPMGHLGNPEGER